ncbi:MULTISPECIES: alpha/beta fold hydrolase [unclassified Microbacterium]|uniref:RBBP9/YdeN family alpha/beta hydrolase n=1 Tax=unclassified Microbacterium TaxID=2609290 RepID=UPI00214CF2AF|nr:MULTISPECIES: alpha/beta fold hydrolase [unclassified Microbacterium]MCR2783102.1 alpha/beta fold hydrolase [Microbacterium sp. zg.B96]WIM16014.1 alpha/beta fold hydrolase [Microbacterium sp. zg-B96]
MTSYVIVPGIGGSDAEHWQSRWEAQWAGHGVRIRPSSWDLPDLADWLAALNAAHREASARDPRVVIVAHSLGCWAAAAWAATQPGAAAAMLLVAPPDPSASRFPREAAPSFSGVQPKPLGGPVIVVASSNDPYGSLDAVAQFASAWHASLREVGACGHLNSASRLGDWPQGRELLVELEHLRAAASREISLLPEPPLQ